MDKEMNKESIIDCEIRGLDELISIVDDNLKTVIVKLKPILRDEPSEDRKGINDKDTTVPLAGVLKRFRLMLNDINDNILDIKNKIEV